MTANKSLFFIEDYLKEVIDILGIIDASMIDKIVEIIKPIKKCDGRIFFLGIGGSAANASHAVNDFRKIVNIEAYAPTDNVSELTARINDSKEGWEYFFADWLELEGIDQNDLLFILSVSGGSVENNTSLNLIRATNYAKSVGCKVVGIIGNKYSYLNTIADAILVIPVVNIEHVTPHSEAFQSVILHLLASHPDLKENPTKWESSR
jgi:D-sedoheptulose 7-phosphate isomerase